MAEEKKAFVVYVDWESQFNLLSDEEAGKLIKHIFSYVQTNGDTVSSGDKLIDLAFCPIKIDLNKELSKRTYGRLHWNWKGGITKENSEIRNSPQMKDWRKDVFQRDNYTCQHCDQHGGNLHAHHVKPFATHPNSRFDIDNGLTLCKKCHNQEHKRMRYER